jgi:acetyltransferase-like isoleucine patch superfamily enzyme
MKDKFRRIFESTLFFYKALRNEHNISQSCKKALSKTKGSEIGLNSVIEDQVVIDNYVRIGTNVVLSHISIGKHSIIESYAKCVGTGKGMIKVGENTYIGISNYLDNSDNITIGDFVQIAGPSTALWTHSGAMMCLNSIPLSEVATTKLRVTSPIIIEDNVYIGGNCTIYPGVHIGHHSVVAPNSAVTKSIPPYSMYGGVPAVFIKSTKKMILDDSLQE